MLKRYLDILNHFGVRNQMKKLSEETYEFLEALHDYEDIISFDNVPDSNCYEHLYRRHVVEELGDILNILTGFIAKYDIKEDELNRTMDFKLERTEERIKEGYYDKK